MEFKGKSLGTARRLQKSHTQQALHRKGGKLKKQKLPSLEERKAGGIYAALAFKNKKPDPLKAQIDLFTHTIQGFDVGYSSRQPVTSRQQLLLPKTEREQLANIRNEFVKRVVPHRLNPITHKDHEVKRHAPLKVDRDVYETNDPKRHLLSNDESSDEEIAKKELQKKDPKYYNLLYHDEDQEAAKARYTSEMREIGRDIKHTQVAKTSNASPR